MLIVVFCLFFCACASQNDTDGKRMLPASDSLALLQPAAHLAPKGADTTISFAHGFAIHLTAIGDTSRLIINHNGKQIYCDTSDVYYDLRHIAQPSFLAFNDSLYEIFLPVDNSPGKLSQRLFKVMNDSITAILEVPVFFAPAGHLYNDTRLVYAGTMEYGEQWTAPDLTDSMSVEPILYYDVTNQGLLLDSVTTIKRNKMIYGVENVFSACWHKTVAVPLDRAKKVDAEIARIMNCK